MGRGTYLLFSLILLLHLVVIPARSSGGFNNLITIYTDCPFDYNTGLYFTDTETSITLYAQLSGTDIANKTVQFMEDGEAVGSVSTDSNGTCYLTYTALATEGIITCSASCTGFGTDLLWIYIGGDILGISACISPGYDLLQGEIMLVTASLTGTDIGGRTVALTLYDSSCTSIQTDSATTDTNGDATFPNITNAPNTIGEYMIEVSYGNLSFYIPLTVQDGTSHVAPGGNPVTAKGTRIFVKNPAKYSEPYRFDIDPTKTNYNFKWWIEQPHAYAHLSGSTTSSYVNLKGVFRSDAEGDVKLHCTYYSKITGKPVWVGTTELTVVKPVKANCTDKKVSFTLWDGDVAGTRYGFVQRNALKAKDKFGQQIRTSDCYWDERWTMVVGGGGMQGGGSVALLNDGTYGSYDDWAENCVESGFDDYGWAIMLGSTTRPASWHTNTVIWEGTQKICWSGWDSQWNGPIETVYDKETLLPSLAYSGLDP